MRGFVDWIDGETGFIVKEAWDMESAKWIRNSRLQLFPEQRRILDYCLTPNEDGDFPFTTIVYSDLKKSGKTAINAAVTAWAAENGPDGSEIYVIANDKEQAQARVFADVRYHVIKTETAMPKKDIIEYENGTFVQVLAQHYASAAGARQFLSTFDELWAYNCIPKDTKILKEDLTWVNADSLKVGDTVVSFDEETDGAYRSFRRGTVIHNEIKVLPTIRAILEDGTELIFTREHKWLGRKGARCSNEWRSGDELKVGDKVMKVFTPWHTEESRDSGYLAAAFDGEGSFVQHIREGWRLDFVQRDNVMLSEVKRCLSKFDFRFWCNKRNGGTNGDVHGLGVAEKKQVMKFLGSIRPLRLLEKVDLDKLGRMTAECYLKVVSIEPWEDMEMSVLGIDTHTYFANGFASHNSERSKLMWAEMTPPPTIRNTMRFISTYAGFENDNALPLYDLYKMCFQEDAEGNFITGEAIPELADIVDNRGRPVCRRNGDVFIYWNTVPRRPWLDEKYYESQMKTQRATDFLRQHRNQWVSNNEDFIPLAMWDKAAAKLQGPWSVVKNSPYRHYPLAVAVDIGTKHDCSAVVAAYYDERLSKCGIALHKIWTPEAGKVLDIEKTAEEFIIEMWKKYNVGIVGYDPSQFLRSAVTLQKLGVPMMEFPQTVSNMTGATQTLYTLLKTENLEAYVDDEIKDHLKHSTVKMHDRGVRIYKDRNSKYAIDGAVALAMAVHLAVQFSGINLDPNEVIVVQSPFSDISSIKMPVLSDFEMKLPEELRSW